MLSRLAAWLSAASIAGIADAICNPSALEELPFIPLGNGPLLLRSQITNNTACIQVELNEPKATWFAIAIAKSSRMINTPRSNAIFYSVHNISAGLYVLQDSAPDGVHFQDDQSSLKVVETTVVNGVTRFTYERPLAAKTAYDVPIVDGGVTTVNWAIGYTQFPGYHDKQGSSKVTFTSTPKPLCNEVFLSSISPVQLGDGPIAIQSAFTDSSTACIQVTLSHPTATWFGISFARTTNMINTPVNNAVVYFIPNNTLNVYELRHAAPEAVIPIANQSTSYKFIQSVAVDGIATYIFERKLAAVSPTDVSISTDKPTILNWAVGFSRDFPNYHDVQGSTKVLFSAESVRVVPDTTTLPTSTIATMSPCQREKVAASSSVPLGASPLVLQSIVVGDTACILVTSNDANLKWFGISFAPTNNMINIPNNNAIVFQSKEGTVKVFDLRDSAPDALTLNVKQNESIRVLHVETSTSKLQYLFERSMSASTLTDIALSRNVNKPTIVNWALGSSEFPDYHDTQGSSNVVFSAQGLLDAEHVPRCSAGLFESLELIHLNNDLSLQYVVIGDKICIQVTLDNPNATWFALAVSPTTNMINKRTNNALVYQIHNASAQIYDLKDAAPDSVVFGASQSSVRVVGSSIVNGKGKLIFERALAAVAPTDVEISLTKETHINWALGFTTFPDYHDVQGSSLISFSAPLPKLKPRCSGDALASLTPVTLGPLLLRTTVIGNKACFHVELYDKEVTWFGLSISPTQNMINKPTNNAIVFHVSNGTAGIYDLVDSAPDSVIYHNNQSSLHVIESSVVDGRTIFTFERFLAAVISTDVAISLNNPTIINWAVGGSTWPDYHANQGSAQIVFAPLTVLVAAPTNPSSIAGSSFVQTDTIWLGTSTFAIMAIFGIIVTHTGSFRWINHQRLTTPPKVHNFLSDVTQTLADIKIGEVFVVLLYSICFVVVALMVNARFADVTAARFLALVSGHWSLLSLMFILLPVARGAHWEWLFGVSHERLIKFHRWLGRLFVLTASLHLYMNYSLATYNKPFGTQEVYPLFGFLAFLSFSSMALAAFESIRRNYFEVFYYYHRVVSVAGLAFILLHGRTIREALVFPLVVYIATLVWRGRGFFNKYQARIVSHLPGTVVFILPSTEQTKSWAKGMNPCSFFWVNIPSVSKLQWHPFSAIVTPDGQSIAFCMKSLKPGSFVDQAVNQANSNLVSMTLYVGGPYGKPAVQFENYDEVILISGGIGVTPMLSLVNQLPHILPNVPSNPHIQFHWVVRSTQELLTAESLMFANPFPDVISSRFYVDGTSIDGSIVASNGQTIPFVGKRPNFDKILHPESYLGKRVCVLVCGPPSLACSVQTFAHNAGFDFHKEIFEY